MSALKTYLCAITLLFLFPMHYVIDATSAGALYFPRLGAPPLPFTSPVTAVRENGLGWRVAGKFSYETTLNRSRTFAVKECEPEYRE